LTAEEYEAAGMIDDDIEGAKEERMFRMWVNSLGIEGVHVSNLVDECRDGVLLCKVLDKVSPGCITWKSVKDPPKTDFDRNINNNTACTACKDLKLKLIGIGGTDLTKGTRKLVLAVVWQIVRLHYLKLIGDKSEDDIVKWANQLTAGKCEPIKNLKDKSMGNGVFLINIAAGIEPRAVNWDIVTAGETDEDKMMNAKYAISLARKLDAVIFCVWEDIVSVSPKQMLIIFSTMMDIHQDRVNNLNK
jgi:plastin-1